MNNSITLYLFSITEEIEKILMVTSLSYGILRYG